MFFFIFIRCLITKYLVANNIPQKIYHIIFKAGENSFEIKFDIFLQFLFFTNILFNNHRYISFNFFILKKPIKCKFKYELYNYFII